MMIGEMDFGATFIDTMGENNEKTNNPENAFPRVAFFFFFVCLVLLTIALMNLLVRILLSPFREKKILRAELMSCFSSSSSEISWSRFENWPCHRVVFLDKKLHAAMFLPTLVLNWAPTKYCWGNTPMDKHPVQRGGGGDTHSTEIGINKQYPAIHNAKHAVLGRLGYPDYGENSP